MITVENNVGRLIEVRQTGRITMEDIRQSGPIFGRILAGIRGKVVMCTDWRGMRVLAPDVASSLRAIIRADNDRVERQAVLLDPSAIIGIQLERLLREGGNMDRAAFESVGTMEQWLAPSLTPAEQAQARKFLGG
ncbi:hypothetical protein [Sandaracinus amylolyticus]|uniref:hypothetical protein n=1 Tax=Sandaracinus amylolyticus TaxID=927083 RepID=UPI001F341DDF|nr:hypothetical protein [Sandaracinus amylolyticus]UJR84767.1 Hypothetical protein I5071_68460 [Sandaracinus amylolyticus]